MSRYLLYLSGCWGLLTALAWGAYAPVPAASSILLLTVGALLTLPLVAFFSGGFGWRRYPSAAFRLYVVRPVLYSQLILPFVAGAGAIGAIVGTLLGHPRAGGQLAATIVLGAAALFMLAGWLGSRALVVRDVEARVPGLPAAFDGLRIAQVSDLHLGPQTSRRFLERVTRAVREQSPDLVTVTGDLIDDRAEDTRLFATWLDTLGEPPHGVYLIPGNHDVYAGWSAVHSGLRAHSRAHVLVNEAQLLTRGGAMLAVVGVGDPAAAAHGPVAHAHAGNAHGANAQASAAPDLPRAFHGIPRGVPVVAFAHNPALWPAIVKRGAALTLSGHTHWGQFAMPRIGWSLASPFLKHSMGAYQDGASLLYVHPGTGFWGIPFRLGAFPEVALITLRAAGEAGITMGKARAA